MKQAVVFFTLFLVGCAGVFYVKAQVEPTVTRRQVKEEIHTELCREIMKTPLVISPTHDSVALQRVIIIQNQKILELLEELKKKN